MPVPAFPSSAEAARQDGFLELKAGIRVYWQRYQPPSPRATVMILPGGGDHSGRYPGLTSALVRAGFTCALLDFRGHGKSNGRRWHVDGFSDYLEDLGAFAAKVRAEAAGQKVFVVGHSQGGLVAALWGLAPGRGVDGFVLSSPYLELALKPPLAKVVAARLVGRLVPFLSVPTGLAMAALTSDPEMQVWTERDPLYGRRTTPRWFEESGRAQVETLRRAREFAYPLLVLTGTADTIAAPHAGRAFVQAASSADKEHRSYEGFRHELFNEIGRERPIADAVAWIASRAGTGAAVRGQTR